MPSLSGCSNLENFLQATTPLVTGGYSMSSLVTAFKIPCAFGIEVKLHQDEKNYFIPTLSALSLPDFSYCDTSPPFLRQTAFHKLEELKIKSDPDKNSWIALLWIPISKIPVVKANGSVLVYYKLYSELDGYLEIIGLLLFKIAYDWITVHNDDDSINVELTNYWKEVKNIFIKQAFQFINTIDIEHHDFNYITSRENFAIQY